MLATETILFVSLCYIGILFAVAYFCDKRADAGRSYINNPYVYALSLAVYCTAWTFYGSVGRAVRSGPEFLAIYIGPTLTATLGWLVLRKILRISRIHRISSIADFIASRYGKSMLLGGLVAVIAVLGIVPYISLQLKAISTSFLLLSHYPESPISVHFDSLSIFKDTAFYVAFILAAFAVLFGTRKPEVTERHEGLVAAIALESVVKLLAFLAIGLFITYGIYDGFGDLFSQVDAGSDIIGLFTLEVNSNTYSDWMVYIGLSMLAIILLPRQFQIAVVENVNEDHLKKAMWLFPLYLLAINLFVLPVAFAGMLQFSGQPVDADTYVLRLPLAYGQSKLALLVFIGGMSAATGMVIVETIALSTMISNNLIMPILLHIPALRLDKRGDLSVLLVAIRHAAIVGTILLGYIYFRQTAEYYSLVAIGLVAFAAVAQFAPALLGGIFWKGGTKAGAVCGLVAGFLVWVYTLVLPTMTDAGLMPLSFIQKGPFGITWLHPFRLFGMTGLGNIAHGVFWSLLFNSGIYIGVSLFSKQSALEHSQAAMFVDVFHFSQEAEESVLWRGTALIPDLRLLLERFLGKERTVEAMEAYARSRDINWDRSLNADPGFVTHVEKLLSGAIGSASARVMVASVVKEESLGIEEVMDIVDETRQVIIYSRELEKATADLKAANEQLKELDRLKDEFISTVTHELRTPLTSIQSIAEILRDYPDTDKEQQGDFLKIMINEIRRLSRLINQVLDFQKIESGRMDWQIRPLDLIKVVQDAVDATRQLVHDKQLLMTVDLPDAVPTVTGDQDQLIQVMINLISNAVKFCKPEQGHIHIILTHRNSRLLLSVEDNGIGISQENQQIIFQQFQQVSTPGRGRPQGSGLGLAITKRIVEFHAGRVDVESELGEGTKFTLVLPIRKL
jgi:Na+/proline symporter/nitrogen-specific signal transduction histidine kinase